MVCPSRRPSTAATSHPPPCDNRRYILGEPLPAQPPLAAGGWRDEDGYQQRRRRSKMSNRRDREVARDGRRNNFALDRNPNPKPENGRPVARERQAMVQTALLGLTGWPTRLEPAQVDGAVPLAVMELHETNRMGARQRAESVGRRLVGLAAHRYGIAGRSTRAIGGGKRETRVSWPL